MRNFLKILMAAVAVPAMLGVLNGCVSAHGNKDIEDPAVIAKIVPGKTTADDVKKLIGDPDKVMFAENDEQIWNYSYVRSETRGTSFIPYFGSLFGGSDQKTKTLTVKFTKSNIVKAVAGGGSTGGGGGLQDSKR